MVHAKMAIDWGRSIGWNIELIRYRNVKVDYYILTDGADCYPWMEYFAILPRKTVAGKRIWWEKAYKRKVWVVWGRGFHMEPETQYATAFDLITHGNNDTFTS